MASNNHNYNNDRDFSEGFNAEPLTQGREIPQSEKDEALLRRQELIERIKDGLHE